MKLRAILITIPVILLISLNVSAKDNPVEWYPKKIEQILGLNESQSHIVTLKANERSRKRLSLGSAITS